MPVSNSFIQRHLALDGAVVFLVFVFLFLPVDLQVSWNKTSARIRQRRLLVGREHQLTLDISHCPPSRALLRLIYITTAHQAQIHREGGESKARSFQIVCCWLSYPGHNLKKHVRRLIMEAVSSRLCFTESASIQQVTMWEFAFLKVAPSLLSLLSSHSKCSR